MNELAVQGANDTNEDIDRDAINSELQALTFEIDRISSTTQFNKKNLLDGTLQDNKLQIGANVGQNIRINISNMDANCIGLELTKTTTWGGTYNGMSVKGYENSTKAKEAVVNIKLNQLNKDIKTSDNGKYYAKISTGNNTSYKTLDAIKSVLRAGVTVASTTRSIRVGVDNFAVANQTLSKVQVAINKVSSERSALGALQNRLEHTITNLNTTSENTSASESKLRDVDMAKEMVEYSKNNILAQAGQSMLAQANQSTQGVLSLLG
jgi:flagellin